MKFDYSNLKGEIKKKYSNVKDFCKEIDIDPATLSTHFSKGTPFKTSQIYKILEVLYGDVTSQDVCLLFLVQKL